MQSSAARNTCSRRTPQCACISENAASLQIAPISPRWFASRSSSAISARRIARAAALRCRAPLRPHARRRCYKRRCCRPRCAPPILPLRDWSTRHERLDALVHIAEPLLEPHHRLAAGGEAEMPRLDDPGMHRADRYLVQALAFDRQEGVGARAAGAAAARAERMLHGPRSRDRARAANPARHRDIAIKTLNSALEPNRRRVQRADRRIASIRAGEA